MKPPDPLMLTDFRAGIPAQQVRGPGLGGGHADIKVNVAYGSSRGLIMPPNRLPAGVVAPVCPTDLPAAGFALCPPAALAGHSPEQLAALAQMYHEAYRLAAKAAANVPLPGETLFRVWN